MGKKRDYLPGELGVSRLNLTNLNEEDYTSTLNFISPFSVNSNIGPQATSQ